jgi:hypothetical protein
MTTMTDLTIRSFEVHVPEEDLVDLRRRVAAARWPPQELVADRSQGVQLATMRELTRYWATEYDWRACEARLNALPQFKTDIDGLEGARSTAAAAGQPPSQVSLPVAFMVFPGEIFSAPRSWAEKVCPNLIYFHEADQGGHFAAWEEPQLFSEEVRAGFQLLR